MVALGGVLFLMSEVWQGVQAARMRATQVTSFYSSYQEGATFADYSPPAVPN